MNLARVVAVVTVLIALAAGTPVQAQTAYLNEQGALVEQDDAAAQNNLGTFYFMGAGGVTQDKIEAARWYRLAAEQGHASAQFNLGSMYDIGDGVPQDDSETLHWFRLAAEQGHPTAQYNVGVMYDNGRGTVQNTVRSYMWFGLALALFTGERHEIVVRARDGLALRMTPEQIAGRPTPR